MSASHLHEFHFIIGRDMKEELMNLDLYRVKGSLSGIIVRILSLISPIIKREHKWGKQRMSRYMAVSENPDEIREHVHVYFPGKMYRELKLMHQDLNCYSIAQLVRDFLKLFIDLIKKFGNKLFKELERIFNKWNEEKVKTRPRTREYIRQLWKIIQHLPGNNRLINIYDRNFSPFWIIRI